MRFKIICLLVMLFLFAGCISNPQAVTQKDYDQKIIEKTEDPTEQAQPTANETVIQQPKTKSNLRNITVSILVDTDAYSPSEEQLKEFFKIANGILINLTDTEMILLSINRTNFTSSIDNRLLRDPLVTFYPANETPEYLIFFKSDKTSAAYGGYFMRLKRSDFCNGYAIPSTGSQSYISVGVIDWSHMFGSCGYNRTDPQHQVHISNLSIDGECRNTKNTPCIFNEKFGYYQCNRDDVLNSLYNSNRYYFAASAAVHELMHNFGSGVLVDHFGTVECDELMGSKDYSLPEGAFEVNCGICPATYDIFTSSYKGC